MQLTTQLRCLKWVQLKRFWNTPQLRTLVLSFLLIHGDSVARQKDFVQRVTLRQMHETYLKTGVHMVETIKETTQLRVMRSSKRVADPCNLWRRHVSAVKLEADKDCGSHTACRSTVIVSSLIVTSSDSEESEPVVAKFSPGRHWFSTGGKAVFRPCDWAMTVF
jgi:hypothetical protein